MATRKTPAASHAVPDRTLGLRERNKLDKRQRIKAAARATFIEKGYDAATTREIAMRADVAIGTLFVYAKDKRDLLLLIVNDELEEATERAFDAVKKKAPLIDQVTAFFKVRYEIWASEPALARPAVRETHAWLAGEDPGEGEVARFYARRTRTVDALRQLIAGKQAQGEIVADERPELIASLLMTIYMTEVRRWLTTPTPQVEAGIAKLRDVLRLAMKGIYAPEHAPARKTAKKSARAS
jgi:AcrR family transcriptional regulator